MGRNSLGITGYRRFVYWRGRGRALGEWWAWAIISVASADYAVAVHFNFRWNVVKFQIK
jgi:hypothetical protein